MLAIPLRRIALQGWSLNREEGQALVEYALIIGLVSVIAIALLTAVGGTITSLFQAVASALNSAL
jgi:pilus assembly protein Flp/PilA